MKLAATGLVLGWGLLTTSGSAQQPATAQGPVARLGAPTTPGTSDGGAAASVLTLPIAVSGKPNFVSQAPPAVVEPPAQEKTSDGAGSAGEGKDKDKKEEKPKGFWETNPPVRKLPWPGVFILPPTGPGYYSLFDCIHDECRDKAPPFPYSRTGAMFNSFFDADFRYLDNPDNKYHDPIFDCLHRIHCGDCWLLSFGGEERLRYMDAENDRLSGKNNNYLLERTRVYGDLWYSNLFRVYVEFLDARSSHQRLNPLPIDQDRGDILNAFVDLNVLALDKYPLYLRVGRQEMLLGSERLVSPLDWANTRRTFQGLSAFRDGENFDFTAFALQPVGIPNATNAGVIDPRGWNNPNTEENFYGVFTTYRPQKGQNVDLYWLDWNNANANASASAPTTTELPQFRTGAFNIHTVGSRYVGDYHGFLWDAEGMYQFGNWAAQRQDVSAAAYTTALGYHDQHLCWNPTFWTSWDWASGNHNPNGDTHGTFNQLFPFNHYYFGQMDLIGRQNIEDINCQLSLWPTNWWLVNLQWHHLWLESGSDALYAPSGAVYRNPKVVNGQVVSGRFIGDMFTITSNFHIDAHQDVLVGYSVLAPGEFLRDTANGAQTPQLFYVQYTFRF
jgi:hypothetical protein